MRDRAGLSQGAIAEALDLKRQTVSAWERGNSNPALDPNQMLIFCELLDVDLPALARAFRGEVEID